MVTRYLLLRKCKRPYTQSAKLAKQAMLLVELSSVVSPEEPSIQSLRTWNSVARGDGPHLYSPVCGRAAVGFVQNSDGNAHIFQLHHFRASLEGLKVSCIATSKAIQLGMRYLCCTCLCQQSKASLHRAYERAPDYYTVQYLWARRSKWAALLLWFEGSKPGDRYHMTNPAYRGLPESLNPENLKPATEISRAVSSYRLGRESRELGVDLREFCNVHRLKLCKAISTRPSPTTLKMLPKPSSLPESVSYIYSTCTLFITWKPADPVLDHCDTNHWIR